MITENREKCKDYLYKDTTKKTPKVALKGRRENYKKKKKTQEKKNIRSYIITEIQQNSIKTLTCFENMTSIYYLQTILRNKNYILQTRAIKIAVHALSSEFEPQRSHGDRISSKISSFNALFIWGW
jgi:hypothetical protein